MEGSLILQEHRYFIDDVRNFFPFCIKFIFIQYPLSRFKNPRISENNFSLSPLVKDFFFILLEKEKSTPSWKEKIYAVIFEAETPTGRMFDAEVNYKNK